MNEKIKPAGTGTSGEKSAVGDGWITDSADSWGTKTFTATGSAKTPAAAKFAANEPGVAKTEKQTPIIVNGLKISRNLRNS